MTRYRILCDLLSASMGTALRRAFIAALLWFAFVLAVPPADATELHDAAVTVDITPSESVALDGRCRARISKTPATHIYATALALESRDGDRVRDQAIMVSCDLLAIPQGILAVHGLDGDACGGRHRQSVVAAAAGQGRPAAKPGGHRAEPPAVLCRRYGGDVWKDRLAELPRHREQRGSQRRRALLPGRCFSTKNARPSHQDP